MRRGGIVGAEEGGDRGVNLSWVDGNWVIWRVARSFLEGRRNQMGSTRTVDATPSSGGGHNDGSGGVDADFWEQTGRDLLTKIEGNADEIEFWAEQTRDFAERLAAAGKLDEAVVILATAAYFASQDNVLHISRANVYLRYGRPDLAFDSCRAAVRVLLADGLSADDLESRPDDLLIGQMIGRALWLEGHPELAVQQFQSTLKRAEIAAPERAPSLHRDIAALFDQLGEPDQARQAWCSYYGWLGEASGCV